MQQCVRERLERLGRRGLIDEVKSGLPGLANQSFDSIDQHIGGRQVVARDVVKIHIAEAAFLPIAAVCDGQLVPAAVRPETVHGIEHVQQRQIVVQRQASVGGRTAFGERDVGLFEVDVMKLARIRAHQLLERSLVLQMLDEREQRSFAGIERYEIEVVENTRLVHGAQLGIAIAAAQYRHDGRAGSA